MWNLLLFLFSFVSGFLRIRIDPTMIFQVLVALFSLSFASGFPLEEYYVNGNGPYPNQQFYYNYQLPPPRSAYFFPNDINKPVYHPELGMSPQYHDLVYNYVKDFAGTGPTPHVNTIKPVIYNADHFASPGNPEEGLGMNNPANENLENDNKEITTISVKDEIVDKPGLKDYFLPSDYFSLSNHPESQFYGHFDAIKTKRINPKVNPTSLPPIGGVISNYVLLRNRQNPQNLLQSFGSVKGNEDGLQHIKRQTADNSDGVEILAEPQNNKMSDEVKEDPENNKEEGQEEMDAHPGIAQSKPSAIALAGPGGMAQASPVGTALVGQGGLAVAAPSGTAVAGPAGQGAIPIQIGGEKQRKETTEKSEESGSY